MTVTDSSEHAEAGESTLLPVAARANVRYISFFLVMWELLPVGRLAVRVSPEPRCPAEPEQSSPAEEVRHVGSPQHPLAFRLGYGA